MHSFLRNKIFSILVIAIVVVTNIFVLMRPQPVYAQFTDPAAAADRIWDRIEKGLVAGGLGALVNGASYFMRKLAYDSAKYLASSAAGQKPLVFQEGFGEYLQNTGDLAAGAAIEQLGAPFGLDLCKPPDISSQIMIQISLSNIYAEGGEGGGGPKKPDCSWTEFASTWGSSDYWEENYSGDALSERFAASLDVTQGDFGIALSSLSKVDRIVDQRKEADLLERVLGEGFKPVKDIISGKILTPSQTIKEESKALTAKHQGEQTSQQIAGIYATEAWQLFPTALSIFANTFISSLLNNIMNDGLLPSPSGEGANVIDAFASSINYNRQAAERAFSYFTAGTPQLDQTAYDVITQYSSCPDNPGLNNCVMDNGLVQVLQRARTGNPMTIAEAIEAKLLHGEWKLLPPSREADNTNIGCYNSDYCYSNVQKLRKVGILPVGFEVAILKSNPDNPWTLGDVVGVGDTTKGFYDCNEDNTPDPAHPYCHLIDPNWLLKAPLAQCTSKVNGPELLSENTPQRRQECADLATCIEYDNNGSCIEYGYCTKERNIWRIPGDTCDEQYNTCQTFANDTTGAIGSYLTRSVDYGTCNAESIGCRAYSLAKDPVGEWMDSTEIDLDDKFKNGHNQTAYFNTAVGQYSCDEVDNGCNLYVDNNTQQQLYLKKAPDYLGCYDIDDDEPGIQWATSTADLQILADIPEQCSDFSGVCVPDEVGCESYSPQNGGFDVTGIVKPATFDTEGDMVDPGNICPLECVGYDTYKQESTSFEESRFPLHFIPDQGESCPVQYSGCDAFVNLSEEAGETIAYFSDIKHCARPDGKNSKVFYTWEGSDSAGYVLKKHTLLKETVNDKEVPAYNGSIDPDLADLCDASSYNVLLENPYDPLAAPFDCRAYYDDAGDISYRLKEYTVTVSDACTQYRKVEPYFVDDADETCTNGGGKPIIVDGVKECRYNTIVSEAQVCPASANRCRAYIGNTANNIQKAVYESSFEPYENEPDSLAMAKEGWSSNTSVVPEATQVGLYSLRVNAGDAVYTFAPGVLRTSAYYDISFWARGVPQQLKISLKGDNNTYYFTEDLQTKESIYAPIDTEWREYKLGPISFMDTSADGGQLIFSRVSGNSMYFIDNILFTGVNGDPDDYKPLIKDSWKTPEGYDVPQFCDSTPTDAFPGEHLGCQLYDYTRAPSESVALNGFDKLCRSEAVGCTEVIDTYNTFPDNTDNVDPTHKLAYNVLCQQGNNVLNNSNEIIRKSCETIFKDEEYSCIVEKGKTSCYIEGPIDIDSVIYEYESIPNRVSDVSQQAPGLNIMLITSSTIITPPDSDVQYLTQFNIATNGDYLCNSQVLGCQEVGLEYQGLPSGDNAYTHSSTHLRVNDPSLYGQILCTEEQEGCSQFSNKSQISYFKDPLLSGRPLCNYKEGVELAGVNYSGWFMDGVGKCSKGVTSDYCHSDDECSGDDNVCEGIGIQACYPSYLQPGPVYGLWSNGSENYDNFVGTCDITQNGCTELIDPADTSNIGDEGQKYYVLDNEKLYLNIDDCIGNKVSQKEGCILFNKTVNPNKPYDSVVTYANSTEKKYELVDPKQVGPTQGDSNMVLKVSRDRQCSEWLACRSSVTAVDELGKSYELCQEYQACSELDAQGDCAKWVKTKEDSNERLTESKYIARGVSWYDSDYTGYSLFNKYNPSDFVYLLFPGQDDAYLGYEMDRNKFFKVGTDDEKFGCAQVDTNKQPIKEEGELCGWDDGGRCYRQRCLYPIDGVFTFEPSTKQDEKERFKENIAGLLHGLTQATCKNYPEASAPFDSEIMKTEDGKDMINPDYEKSKRFEFNGRLRPFERANVCQIGSDENGKNITDCSCEYLKVEYNNGLTDYWPVSTGDGTPAGVCTGGGEKDGKPCSKDTHCNVEDGVPGICSLKIKQGQFIGQKGLCLEYDRSRPLTRDKQGKTMHEQFACLTWLPIQVSASAVDLYNTNLDAGYYPELDAEPGVVSGELYCLNATRDGQYYDKNMTGDPPDVDVIKTKFNVEDTDSVGLSSAEREYFKTRSESEKDGVTSDGLWGVYLANDDKKCSSNGEIVIGAGDDGHNTGTGCADDYTQLNLSCGTISSGSTQNDYDGGFEFYEGKSNVSKFVSEICEDDMTNAYRSLQAWAWYVLGDEDGLGGKYVEENKIPLTGGNAVVLRIDDKEKPKFAPIINPGVVTTTVITPGDISSFSGGEYISEYESIIIEDDIEKLCFVPLMVPSGIDSGSFMPALMEDSICILPEQLKEGDSENGMVWSIDQARVNLYKYGNDSTYWKTVYQGFFDDDDYVGFKNGEIEFPLERVQNGGNVWTYFKKGTDSNRYVAVIYDNKEDNTGSAVDKFPSDDSGPSTKKFPDSDPFDLAVKTEQNNWVAIAVDFDENTGALKGYTTRYYHGGAGESGIRFAVIATLFNKCVDVVSVHDSSKSVTESRNKAWTQKTWVDADDISMGNGVTSRLTKNMPYGSLPLKSNVINDNNALRQFSFVDSNADGIPLSCTSTWNGLPTKETLFCEKVGNSKGSLSGQYIDFHNIFAKYYSRVQFIVKDQKYKSIGSTGQGTSLDISDDLEETGTQPPHIYSVNYRACDEGTCIAAEIDNFTLNKRNYTLADYDGDTFPDEDKIKNNAPDPIIAQGTYPAVVQFYGIADDNHMPIRRVMVDWGDSTPVTNDGRYGMYKNRKPFCGETSDSGRCLLDRFVDSEWDYAKGHSQMTCSDDFDCRILSGFVDVDFQQSDSLNGGGVLKFTNSKVQAIIKFPKPFPPGSTSEDIDIVITPTSLSVNKDFSYHLEDVNNTGFTIVSDGFETDDENKSFDWVATIELEHGNYPYRCDTDIEPRFGDATRACKDEYFEFSHMYYCDLAEAKGEHGYSTDDIAGNKDNLFGIGEKAILASKEAHDRLLEQGVKPNEKVCVFKPGVQVLDNWGYCNGTGVDGEYLKKYNYEDNEQCNEMENKNIYSRYNGAIIVIPEKE